MKKSSRPVHHSQPLHPWYYVKGRNDLTERNISSRRERQDQRHRVCLNNNHYFHKHSAQNKLYEQWNENKGLVKHSNDFHSFKPPFDTIEPKVDSNHIRRNKETDRKYLESKQELSLMLNQFKGLDEEYNELQKNRNTLITNLNELQNIESTVDQNKEFSDLKVKRLFYLRFGRQKLRHKVFIICDQLMSYKIAVKTIEDMKIGEGVLTGDELIQINEVNERAVKILDMYIQINQNRNTEFQMLYHEEGEQRWLTQELEWGQEYQVWNSLLEKLLDSYKDLITDKLSNIISAEKVSLNRREELLVRLSSHVNQLKSDPRLSTILQDLLNMGSYKMSD